jgi:hypothetical protein
MTVAHRGPGRGIPSLRARGVRRFPPVIFPCAAGHIPLSAQVRDAAGERRTPGSRCNRAAPWPQDRRPCRPGETAGRAGAGREGTRRVRWPRPGDDAARESPRTGNAVSAERNPRTRCPPISPEGTQPQGFALSREFNDMRLLCPHAYREEKRIPCYPP